MLVVCFLVFVMKAVGRVVVEVSDHLEVVIQEVIGQVVVVVVVMVEVVVLFFFCVEPVETVIFSRRKVMVAVVLVQSVQPFHQYFVVEVEVEVVYGALLPDWALVLEEVL